MLVRAILTHGGSSSDPNDSNGPEDAAILGMQCMRNGETSLSAVVLAVKTLEDDPRFNAGLGSILRKDKQTIQLDASCMKDNGDFGAVAVIENVINPILVARKVMEDSPAVLLVGKGAEDFAKKNNLTTKKSNHLKPLHKTSNSSCDTVGAVAFDGQNFAAALSSGGLENAWIGRVGDVPLPGCGLFCGPSGAVACTGDGESIVRKLLAREVYSWIEGGMDPSIAAKKAVDLFNQNVDIGIIIITKNGFGICSKNGMASSQLLENKI